LTGKSKWEGGREIEHYRGLFRHKFILHPEVFDIPEVGKVVIQGQPKFDYSKVIAHEKTLFVQQNLDQAEKYPRVQGRIVGSKTGEKEEQVT